MAGNLSAIESDYKIEQETIQEPQYEVHHNICLWDCSKSFQPSQAKNDPRMHSQKNLATFENGWPWPICQGHRPIWMIHLVWIVCEITGKVFNPESSNLSQGCFLIRPWPGSMMTDLDLFFKVRAIQMIHLGRLVCMITGKVFNRDSSNLSQGCILIRPQPSSMMSDLEPIFQGQRSIWMIHQVLLAVFWQQSNRGHMCPSHLVYLFIWSISHIHWYKKEWSYWHWWLAVIVWDIPYQLSC